MLCLRIALVALAAVAVEPVISASPILQGISQTVWVKPPRDVPEIQVAGTFEFNRFDPSLGTLVYADLSVYGFIPNSYRLVNPSDSPVYLSGYIDIIVTVAGVQKVALGPEGVEAIPEGFDGTANTYTNVSERFDLIRLPGIQGNGTFLLPFAVYNNLAFGVQPPGFLTYLPDRWCPCDEYFRALSFTLSYGYEPSAALPPPAETPEPVSAVLVGLGAAFLVTLRRTRSAR